MCAGPPLAYTPKPVTLSLALLRIGLEGQQLTIVNVAARHAGAVLLVNSDRA